MNGSVQDVVNNAGHIVDHVVFDAFGNKIVPDMAVEGSASPSLYGFQGMMQDPAAEPVVAGVTTSFLYYDNARWFSASTGEFLSRDPANADNNTYRFAGNNPITNTDPTGLEPKRQRGRNAKGVGSL